MVTEWELREVIDRCISLMVAHHEDDGTPEAEAMMAAEIETIAARKSRSPEWFDPAHSAATGPPTVPVTAGGGESSGSTPGRRPMIRMLPDRKTVTARHPYQG